MTADQERAAVVACCENCRFAKALNVADPGKPPEPPKPRKGWFFTHQPHWLEWDFHLNRMQHWAERKAAADSVLCQRYPSSKRKRKTSVCGEFEVIQ